MRNQLENFVAGEDITAPALVYFDATDGFAYLASAITTDSPAQAMVLIDCDYGESGQAYFWGVVDYAFGEVSQATPLYLSETSGGITSTAPANAQHVGFVINSGMVFLNFAGFSSPESLTSTQKEGIASPQNGREVWDETLLGKCVYDGVKWLRLSQKSAPTIAVGAGAGSGATVTVSGNDIEGLITLTGGTSATASATFFTLTFFDSFTTAPIAVMISESNQNALLMPVGRKPGFDTVSTTTFTMVNAAANGIINGTVYKYTYRVIQ